MPQTFLMFSKTPNLLELSGSETINACPKTVLQLRIKQCGMIDGSAAHQR